MIGVALIAFDRPDYVRRLLASLEQQTDLDGVAFHCFQDGAVNAYSGREAGDPDGIEEVRALWGKAKLPGKGIAQWRIQNASIGIHQFEALEWMCERYAQVVMLEDDVVLSPHWLRLAKVVYGQMVQWPDVFSFSLGFKRHCKRGQTNANLDKLMIAHTHWWAECMTAANWGKARQYFLPYYQLIKGRDYRDRDHDAIRALYASVGWERPYTTQDCAKEMAAWRAGMMRVVAVVNRAIGIGQWGEHFRPEWFHRLGLDEQAPYTFDGDAMLEGFELDREVKCESPC